MDDAAADEPVAAWHVGNVLLGKGMRGIGNPPNWSPASILAILTKTFANAWIWLGIGSLLLFLVLLMLVLSWADYSFVMPASAISYAVAAFLAHAILGEQVTRLRWLGVFLICLGVGFVTRTAPTTGEPE